MVATSCLAPTLALLGDSIFDNRAYTEGGPAVIDQVATQLPSPWTARLLAVDGDVAADVHQQLDYVSADVTHLVLSVGGNDALGALPAMQLGAATVHQALGVLAEIQSRFALDYGRLLDAILALKRPLIVCTIYDAVPGLDAPLRAALSLFNDVITRNALARGLQVVDLRMICTEVADYSAVSPIEPSSAGGAKLAAALVAAVLAGA